MWNRYVSAGRVVAQCGPLRASRQHRHVCSPGCLLWYTQPTAPMPPACMVLSVRHSRHGGRERLYTQPTAPSPPVPLPVRHTCTGMVGALVAFYGRNLALDERIAARRREARRQRRLALNAQGLAGAGLGLGAAAGEQAKAAESFANKMQEVRGSVAVGGGAVTLRVPVCDRCRRVQ